MRNVRVDHDLCQAYGNCVVTAPEVFELDPDSGMANVIQPDPPPEHQPAVEQAIQLCPMRAISADAE